MTISYTGFKNGDDAGDLDTPPVASTTAGVATPVGDVAITLSSGSDNNYSINTTDGTLSIIPASLTATADDKSKVYGEANPALTITYSGFKNGDGAGDLDTPPVASTTAGVATPVGDVAITLSSGSDNNYSINTTDGTLSIIPASLTATADDKSKVYGEANPALTISYTGFKNGDDAGDLDTPPVASTAADVTTTVGDVAITLSAPNDDNYNITTVVGTLTIAKAPLVAKADNKARAYGESNPVLTISYSGFVNDEDAIVLDELPIASTLANESSVNGEYNILLSGGSDDNYELELQNGTLTVGKAEQAITFTALASKNYGDAPFELEASSNSGLAVIFSSSDSEVLSIEGTSATILKAGTVTITASQEGDENYIAAEPVLKELTIGKVWLTVTADDKARAYGEANPEFTLSYTGFVSDDDKTHLTQQPEAITSATIESNAGQYDIIVQGGASSNYNFEYVTGTLSINKAAQEITFGLLDTVRVGDTDFTLGATTSSGLEVSYSVSLAGVVSVTDNVVSIIDEGKVLIIASQSGNENYAEATNVSQELVVLPPSSIHKIELGELKVYPNPANEFLVIESEKQYAKIIVYSVDGRSMLTDEFPNGVLNTSNLYSGYYILKLVNSDEAIVGIATFIKH